MLTQASLAKPTSLMFSDDEDDTREKIWANPYEG